MRFVTLNSVDSLSSAILSSIVLLKPSSNLLGYYAVGAIQAVAREGFSAAVQGGCKNTSAVTGAPKKRLQRFPDLKGENNKKSVEALITNTGKETMQWGFAAGMYSGLTYGLKEARGVHDWKNSALAGAVTGAALALTTEDHSHEQVVQCAITGAAISTVANLLTGVF
ncbi:PREDICTED: outer envelope pore protein 16-2, chloroplastic-like isoform X2 [Ipomoea nil]|uniref:outer envelope pore protein 16-2, chloroplastic-like isoform X2 n=1 Tax=Ipomoea nil TaxID=35883 RepID=UPI000900AE3A|nr:PREDICTED: outer envelope pore protein 16-2, chloroplastic-like isoform X2 [Ipomoea nil]